MSVGTLLSDVVGPDGQFYSLAPSHAPTIALSNPESDRSLHPVHPSRAHHPDMIPQSFFYESSRSEAKNLAEVRAAVDRLEYELEERRRDDRTVQEEKAKVRKKKMGETKKKASDPTFIVVASAVAVVAIVVVLVLFLTCTGKKNETPSIVYHVYTQSAPVPTASYVLPPATAQPFYFAPQ